MEKQFILLTKDDGMPIIIGISNIATITAGDIRPDTVTITLNYVKGKEWQQKLIIVKESFDAIKLLLGL